MKRSLFLGRFQPPHRGHLQVIQKAAQKSDEVIVVVGSAQESFTHDNPFTAAERVEMLRAALAQRGITNALVIPVLDLHRHAQWVAYIESLVPPFDDVVSNNPLTKVLFGAAGYRVRSVPWFEPTVCSGTRIRSALATGGSLDEALDASVRTILSRIKARDRLRKLAQPSHGRGTKTP